MKKGLFLIGLMLSLPAFAETDPFSVYSAKAPEGCIEIPATQKPAQIQSASRQSFSGSCPVR